MAILFHPLGYLPTSLCPTFTAPAEPIFQGHCTNRVSSSWQVLHWLLVMWLKG